MAEKRTTSRKSGSKPGPRSRPAKRPPKNTAPPAAVVPQALPPVPAPTAPPAPAAASPVPVVTPARRTLGGPLVLVVALVVIVAAVAGGLLIRGGAATSDFKLGLGVPTEASADDLRAFASPSRPVYWIGPANSGTLEVTRTANGAVFVRYLPAGVDVGDRAPSYTTIATYSTPDAYETMQRSATTRGFKRSEAANGGLAVWQTSKATSVYLALPESDYLVEIFDPSPRRARTLALSARLRRVP